MKLKRIANLLLVLLVTSPVAGALEQARANESTQAARVAHYSQLIFRESPFADLRGAYPIAPELAKSYKHYRFVYDQYDRVIEVTFRHGDDIHSLNISRTALLFTPVIQLEYSKNKEIRTFYDRFMNPVTSNGSFREEFDLDDDGNRIALRFYDFNDQPIENQWGISRYEWSIDSRGTVTENRYNLKQEPVPIRPHFPFFCLKLHYDQRGLLSMMENYGKNCEHLTNNELNAAQDRLQYDSHGGFYAWNVYDADEKRAVGNGPEVARGVIVRDSRGHSIGEFYQDTQGQIMTNSYGWTNTKASFDGHGNMIRRLNLNSNDEPEINANLGYQGYYAEYDSLGVNRELLRYIDINGQPATHKTRGFHAVEIEYDEVGNQLQVSYKDAKGRLIDRLDNCVAIIRYAYDSRHRRISAKRYNASNEATESCNGKWHETNYYYFENGPLSRTERH